MKIDAILDNDRKRLLQLTGNNPSLNCKTYRNKGISAIDTNPAALIFNLINGSEVKITHLPPITKNAGEPQSVIQFDGTDEELDLRLSKTLSETRLVQEEQGVNILNIAIGTLTWRESPQADKLWNAPLVLIPVKLEKKEKGNHTVFSITYNEEEIEPNHALYELLQSNYHLHLPVMPEWDCIEGLVETVQAWTAWITGIQDCIKGFTDWTVKEQQLQISFFSFAKYQMYKDLQPEKWESELSGIDEGVSIISELLADGFQNEKDSYPEGFHIDKSLPADQPTTIEKLDSTQAAALLEARNARCLVIQGPPGTGKSTTISNIIADAVLQGKKILFVAEKMAALHAVKDIFVRNRMEHLCLELHGNKTQKTIFLEELRTTIEDAKGPATLPVYFDPFQLNKERDELRNWSDLINLPSKNGYSPYELFGLLFWCRKNYDLNSFPTLSKLTNRQVEFEGYVALLDKTQIGNLDFEGTETQSIRLFTQHFNAISKPLLNCFYGSEREVAPFGSELQELNTFFISFKQELGQRSDFLSKVITHFPWLKVVSISSVSKAIQYLGILLSVPDGATLAAADKDWGAKRKELEQIITWGKKASEEKDRYKDVLHNEAWQEDLRDDWTILSSTSNNLFNRWFNSSFKAAKNHFASLYSNPANASFGDFQGVAMAIFSYQDNVANLSNASIGDTFFGAGWKGINSNWTLLQNILEWHLAIAEKIKAKSLPSAFISFLTQVGTDNDLNDFRVMAETLQKEHNKLIQLLTNLRDKLKINMSVADEWKEMSFSDLKQKLQLMADYLPDYQAWINYCNDCKKLKATNKTWLVQGSENWNNKPEMLFDYWRYKVWEQLLQNIMTQYPALQQTSHNRLDQLRSSFQEHDMLLQEYYKVTVLNKQNEALRNLGNIGQAAFIRKNLQRKRNIPSIRRFMQESFDAIASVKPVFMMSPLSVAGYLEAKPGMFDMVIFDEASQVEPVDALGAILRSKQVIVVGDTKQMPPTSFFKNMLEGADDGDSETETLTADVQSIMELMLARNARSRSLLWHYRSRHESLINTSNEHFYNNRLLVYPSAIGNDPFLGLKFKLLDHTMCPYEGNGLNKGEAKAVALAVLEFAQQHADKSLGVVAFNIRQKEAIEKEVEKLAKQYPELTAFCNKARSHPFFIKNLENVQGDERDVIFISIGYGKTSDGSFGLNFGPLNRDGGERRFNVLITRARSQNRIFANFEAGDIRADKTEAKGIHVLKDYLHYAANGKPLHYNTSQGTTESVFEDEVLAAVRQLGYQADTQLGSQGYRIDIAVRHPEQPGRYTLAIECDGATYHAAKSTRDRDRLRQSVLEQYGWSFYRIWSSNWFYNQHNELIRLKEAIEQSIAAANSDIQQATVTATVAQSVVFIQADKADATKSFSSYTLTPTHTWKLQENFFKQENPLLERYMLHVIHAESPVHVERIFHRLTSFQGTRQGSRIRQLLETLLGRIIANNSLTKKGDFIWTNISQLQVIPRDHSAAPDKDIDRIAPEELKAALELVKKSSFGATEDEIITETLKRLGFTRFNDEMIMIIKKYN